MGTTNCLNCGNTESGKYCNQCGQKMSVHRLSIVHFLAHDLVHGLLHVDRGILFNLKSLFKRPGYAAREYLEGKRAPYFSFVTLFILVTGLILITDRLVPGDLEFVVETESGSRLDAAVVNNLKFLLLGFIPLLSLSTAVFFRRMKRWYSEHLVANTFLFTGVLLIYWVYQLVRALQLQVLYMETMSGVELRALVVVGLQLLFLCRGYYHFTRNYYSVPGFLWRLTGVLVLFLFLSIAVYLVFAGYFEISSFGWEAK